MKFPFGQLRWNNSYGKMLKLVELRDTCYALGKKKQNLQLLYILACNSADKPSFYGPKYPEVADFGVFCLLHS